MSCFWQCDSEFFFFAKGFKEVEMNTSGSKDFPIDFVAILHHTAIKTTNATFINIRAIRFFFENLVTHLQVTQEQLV